MPLRTWIHDHNAGAKWTERAIEAPVWDDIAGNYPPSTREALHALNRLERPIAAGRLILWHGLPGTGKTTAVRALLRSWEPWCSPTTSPIPNGSSVNRPIWPRC